jgi:hypothetical protein
MVCCESAAIVERLTALLTACLGGSGAEADACAAFCARLIGHLPSPAGKVLQIARLLELLDPVLAAAPAAPAAWFGRLAAVVPAIYERVSVRFKSTFDISRLFASVRPPADCEAFVTLAPRTLHRPARRAPFKCSVAALLESNAGAALLADCFKRLLEFFRDVVQAVITNTSGRSSPA